MVKRSPSRPVIRGLLALASINLCGIVEQTDAQVNPAPLRISRANQNAVLSWFGENQVAYQLELSGDLVTWGELGTVTIGTGNFFNFAYPITGQSRAFFRLTFPGVQSAIFDSGTGALTIIGDNLDNIIVASRDAAGNLLINNGAIFISGGMPTVANTTVIRIYGREGADQISLDETNGPLPKAELYGEGGNDTLTGGSGDDVLIGGAGNDTLLGKGGTDTLFGGDNDDILTGGSGDDQVFGENDNDRLVWNNGDGTDLNEGGNGVDTVEVSGGNGAEVFTTTANGTRVRFDRVSPVPFTLDIGTCEKLVVNMNGGNDQFSATGNLAALIQITVDGGAGDDILLGSNGADTLIGGDDNDFIDGNQGNDVAFLGNGNDTFQWDPGDGSDTIEGQAGNDRLLFNGSNANEMLAVSANGARVRVTRDIGAIVMDLDDVETFELNALGGTDTLTVNDLTGTDLTNVLAHLVGSGGVGDGQVDTVNINGTAGVDSITTMLPASTVQVTGLTAYVSIDGYEAGTDIVRIDGQGADDILHVTNMNSGGPMLVLDGGSGTDTVEVSGLDVAEDFTTTANGTRVRFDRVNPAPFSLDIGSTEKLVLNANGGNDTFSAAGNLAALIQITVDGGAGDDTLLGSNGADVLLGGDDNDFIDGNQGNDVVFLGAGNDTFQWDPGDGSDTVEGQTGHDIVIFNGANVNETFTFFANGARLLFTRNVAAVTLDMDDIEQFDLRAFGGVDTVNVNDLTGTDLTQVNIELAGTLGGASGDGQADSIILNGTAAPDTINLIANAGGVDVSSLTAGVRIAHPEVTTDHLTVNGLGGADTFNVGPGVTALINVTTNQ